MKKKMNELVLLAKRPSSVDESSRIKDQQREIVQCNRFTRDLEFYYSPGNLEIRQAALRISAFMDLIIQQASMTSPPTLMLKALATASNPIIPEFSRDLWAALDLASDGGTPTWVTDWAGVL
jgi:hypothetical protein